MNDAAEVNLELPQRLSWGVYKNATDKFRNKSYSSDDSSKNMS